MSDWCGMLMLHGSEKIERFLHWNSNIVVSGSFEDGRHDFGSEPTYMNSGNYAIMGKPTSVVPVPSKGSSYLEWSNGPTYDDRIKKLLKLNGVRKEGAKYSDLVNGNVYTNEGRWASCIAVLTKRSILHIGAFNMEVYMWLMRFRKSTALVWSTDPGHAEQCISIMTEIEQNEMLTIPIKIQNSLCIVNPMFMIGRFRQAMLKTFPNDEAAVLSYMLKYIQKHIEPVRGTDENKR